MKFGKPKPQEIVRDVAAEDFPLIERLRYEFVSAMVNALPAKAMLGGDAEFGRYMKLIAYVRELCDEWYDSPESIAAVSEQMDRVEAMAEEATAKAKEWAEKNAKLEEDIVEKLPLSADETFEVTTAILADVEKDLVKVEALAPVITKLDTLMIAVASAEIRLDNIENPPEPKKGLTNDEKKFVKRARSHIETAQEGDHTVYTITPADVAEHEAELATCPPHHWTIDTLDGSTTVGGTCKRCAMRREDFDPVGTTNKKYGR